MKEAATGVTDQAAADQKGAGETKPEERTVPLPVLKQMEEKLKTLADQNKVYQAQLAQAMKPQPKQQPKEEPEYFGGMKDDEILTVGDQKKVLHATKAELQEMVAALGAEMAQLKFAMANPDWQETIPKLKTVMDSDPVLAGKIMRDIQSSPNPMETAYNYAKLASGQPKQEPDFMAEFEKIMKNQEKPTSPAAVGGAGAVAGGNKYSGMSDSEFVKHIQKVKGLS